MSTSHSLIRHHFEWLRRRADVTLGVGDPARRKRNRLVPKRDPIVSVLVRCYTRDFLSCLSRLRMIKRIFAIISRRHFRCVFPPQAPLLSDEKILKRPSRKPERCSHPMLMLRPQSANRRMPESNCAKSHNIVAKNGRDSLRYPAQATNSNVYGKRQLAKRCVRASPRTDSRAAQARSSSPATSTIGSPVPATSQSDDPFASFNTPQSFET